jgi:hypothetical protein
MLRASENRRVRSVLLQATESGFWDLKILKHQTYAAVVWNE